MSNKLNIPIEDAFEATHLSSTFNCTLENIPEFCRLYPKGRFVCSDPIVDVGQFMNANVYLMFYPSGDTTAKPNYCSLFLNGDPVNMNKCFSIMYTFSVIDDDGHCVARSHDVEQISQNGFFNWGFDFRNVTHDGKPAYQLRVNVEMTIVTARAQLHWLKLYPQLKRETVNVRSLRDTAMAFDDQSFDDDTMALIEVNGERDKLFKVSKEIVCNSSDVFAVRLTKKEWMSGEGENEVYKISGYSSDLVNKFLKSIHTGTLRWDNWQDQLNLLEIAEEYQVKWIKAEACDLLGESLTLENAIPSFIRADESNARELRGKCLKFCIINYHQLRIREDWKELVEDHDHCKLAFEILADIALGNKNPVPSKPLFAEK